MSGPCSCPHCTAPEAVEAVLSHPVVPDLPEVPAPIRVHYLDGRTQDCTLHPDGALTMRLLSGEVLRNAFSLEEMCEQNWHGCRIELDPPPDPERLVAEQPALPTP